MASLLFRRVVQFYLLVVAVYKMIKAGTNILVSRLDKTVLKTRIVDFAGETMHCQNPSLGANANTRVYYRFKSI